MHLCRYYSCRIIANFIPRIALYIQGQFQFNTKSRNMFNIWLIIVGLMVMRIMWWTCFYSLVSRRKSIYIAYYNCADMTWRWGNCSGANLLKHWNLNKMAFTKVFAWMNNFVSNFIDFFYPKGQSKHHQHWFLKWLYAQMRESCYQNRNNCITETWINMADNSRQKFHLLLFNCDIIYVIHSIPSEASRGVSSFKQVSKDQFQYK